MKKIIAVGLSGGVDSSVSAYLLQKKGYTVIGLWMDITGQRENEADARRVAEFLSIPFYRIDLSKEYEKSVITYIKNEYSSGKTPNPCVRCNRDIKFGMLLEKALSSGIVFDLFATGHYALLEKDERTGRFLLKKSVFEEKDQVYFLSMLTQSQLGRLMFPLGEMRKSDVKKIASDIGLFTALKKESQDLCTGDYRDFIDHCSSGGRFIDKNGKILGVHNGIENYTIGQRRGLGISSSGSPYYVIEIDPEENTVILGFDEDLKSSAMVITDMNWIAVEKPVLPLRTTCKIRYRDKGSPAVLTASNEEGSYIVHFEHQRRAITPGQVAVFYEENTVLGAGIIVSSL